MDSVYEKAHTPGVHKLHSLGPFTSTINMDENQCHFLFGQKKFIKKYIFLVPTKNCLISFLVYKEDAMSEFFG